MTLDDGATDAGSVRVIANQTWDQAAAVASIAIGTIVDSTSYTVCMAL